jgi:uncharacterized protein
MRQSPNRLAGEASPYLQQHAHNPVDWYPWSEEALTKARDEDKPILLSIGYSACHWCHVMEKECFENEGIARLMNELFVNVKVDREERPDLDAIYMDFVQISTGGGGWPLTAFLTPDQIPFFGGTYFPPEDRYGRPGFPKVLESVAQVYRTRREELLKESDRIVGVLRQASSLQISETTPDLRLLDEAYQHLSEQFDSEHGGFGGAPKFPATMALGFLLRYYQRTGIRGALEMVTLSLDQMASGGIYDHVGGGFHRYSVDERWLVPHFEKMLYDNALLVRLYLEAFQITGRETYRRVVTETLDYVKREMLDPAGGFYSSQDADSEGEEGKFYVWSAHEVAAAAGPERARLFNDFYDITATGNFEGSNIPHPRFELEAFAKRAGVRAEDLSKQLDETRRILYAARKKRVPPATDDKVLAAWNGMMLGSFVQAAFVLNDAGYLEVARRNAQFLTSELLSDRLYRSWKAGSVSRIKGYLEDYSSVIDGLISLYEASGELRWIETAKRLMELQIELFLDRDSGDFYFTPVDHEQLLVRQKDYADNATPSGNSLSSLSLLKLARLLDEPGYWEMGARILHRMAAVAAQHPLAFGVWLQSLTFYLTPVKEIVLVGTEPGLSELIQPLRETFLPNHVRAISSQVTKEQERAVPLFKEKSAIDRKPAAYVCENYACRLPARSPDEFRDQLTAIVNRADKVD